MQNIIEQLRPSREVPTFQDVMTAVRSFAQVDFDVPTGPNSDGFLFQYGEVNWLSGPTFTVGFVRQMEFVDAEGEHEGYSQVQLEYRYPVDADLRSLESHSSWWFHDDGNHSKNGSER
ncbi:hypothetical protein WDH52_10300 [Streptomyces sp. TRM70308]|uniref:hypothetical protein n=1 Tax=Streptomyces sp. TRM70308 TaxID=3131932 RepID=UPI003D064D16